ncbi:hypothetical protein [Clostridium saccharoperbutylacetonicum]|uniref:hypothetical protein n=1 Tax=Clostridium saccharoperbutylacetonicum TaxID=36745 RepID=UPI0039EB7CDB
MKKEQIENRKLSLVGEVFTRLTVVGATEERNKKGCIIWECKCVCGNIGYVSTTELTGGNTKSCGCLHIDNGYLAIYEKNVFEQYENTCVSIIKNKKANKNSKTKIKGVYFCNQKNKFVASIMFKRKHYYLGSHDLIEEAISARKLAEENLHNKFIEWYELNKVSFIKKDKNIKRIEG